jgi:hypothetical protein
LGIAQGGPRRWEVTGAAQGKAYDCGDELSRRLVLTMVFLAARGIGSRDRGQQADRDRGEQNSARHADILIISADHNDAGSASDKEAFTRVWH